jgi:hypothetical protein
MKNHSDRHRWENATRYVEARVMVDLWGESVLVKAWGGKGNRLGSLQAVAVGSEQIAQELAKIAKTRRQRGYTEITTR